jgi:hypothetical protein
MIPREKDDFKTATSEIGLNRLFHGFAVFNLFDKIHEPARLLGKNHGTGLRVLFCLKFKKSKKEREVGAAASCGKGKIPF